MDDFLSPAANPAICNTFPGQKLIHFNAEKGVSTQSGEATCNRYICWNCNLKCVNRVVLSKLLAKLHELGPVRASLRMIYDLDVLTSQQLIIPTNKYIC
jgi:hypothetical protein